MTMGSPKSEIITATAPDLSGISPLEIAITGLLQLAQQTSCDCYELATLLGVRVHKQGLAVPN